MNHERKNHMADAAVFVGRLLLAVLFLGGALQKAVDPAPAMGLLADRGWPSVLIWPALAFNGAVGLGLVLGWQVRAVSLAAALYCAVTSLFHFLPDDPWQMSIFVKNWAIAGGLLVLGAHGSGRWVLQRRRATLGSQTDET
ncbi:DoxX family protein [Thalassorhabdomicrobium marinisediminis]|nr:DoxX family protein [Thalassorhabdomicrobium marinisediminis]